MILPPTHAGLEAAGHHRGGDLGYPAIQDPWLGLVGYFMSIIGGCKTLWYPPTNVGLGMFWGCFDSICMLGCKRPFSFLQPQALPRVAMAHLKDVKSLCSPNWRLLHGLAEKCTFCGHFGPLGQALEGYPPDTPLPFPL